MNAYDIIKKPLLSEKSYAKISDKIYTFVVDKNATKIDVKNAVEQIFNVQVEKVNTLNVKGHEKSQNTKKGRKEQRGRFSAVPFFALAPAPTGTGRPNGDGSHRTNGDGSHRFQFIKSN